MVWSLSSHSQIELPQLPQHVSLEAIMSSPKAIDSERTDAEFT